MQLTEPEMTYLLQLMVKDIVGKQQEGKDTAFEASLNLRMQITRLDMIGDVVPDELRKKAGEVVSPPAQYA